MVFKNIYEIAPESDGKWVFQDVADAIKIQGYETAPSGNPAPGQFTYYKGRELEIVVDAANFYGIHLDVDSFLQWLLQRHIQDVDSYCAQGYQCDGDNQHRQRDVAQKASFGIAGELFQRDEKHQYRQQFDEERP